MPFFCAIIIIGDSMKRGFTLVELLAVIMLIGVVSLIAVPSIGKILKRSRLKAQESTKNELIKAAKKYSAENIRNLSDDGSYKCLSVSEIEESGYISNDDIIDPKTKKKLTGYIKIYFDNTYNQYTYEYVESCE